MGSCLLPYLNLLFVHRLVCRGIWYFQFSSKKWKRMWRVLVLFGFDLCHLQTTHAPIMHLLRPWSNQSIWNTRYLPGTNQQNIQILDVLVYAGLSLARRYQRDGPLVQRLFAQVIFEDLTKTGKCMWKASGTQGKRVSLDIYKLLFSWIRRCILPFKAYYGIIYKQNFFFNI